MTESPPASRVTGYVLAGGQSSRMGRDKALLDNNGPNLLQRALEALSTVCAATYILSGPRNSERDTLLSRYAPLVPDAETSHAGPVAGLLAALHHCRTLYACIVAVDQPGIGAGHLRHLIDAAWNSGAAVTCFQQPAGSLEPMPVVIATRLHGALLQQWRAGERRFLAILQAAAQHAGSGPEATSPHLLALPLPVDSSPGETSPLTNLNTPAELESWRSTRRASNQTPSGASE